MSAGWCSRGTVWPAAGILLAMLLAGCATDRPFESDRSAAAAYNVQLGYGYMSQGQYERALAKFKKALEQSPRDAEAHAGLGQLYGRLQQDRQARHHFEQALSYSKDDPAIRNSFGAYLCTEGEFDTAERYFLAAARDPDYGTPAYAYANAGICAADAGQPRQAEALLREALQIDPLLPSALWEMAKVHLTLDEPAVAEAYLRRYRSVAPDSAQVRELASDIAQAAIDAAPAEDGTEP
ncbi:MAG: type IV pilus biogenesis/stability protein PilW [Pseudomonadota bacterium]|nr:type IV pilus biogenesis/stability protein PilW [Pseudomonadota bacterium]HJO36770.1 type IV pilus biogenesis/stability protein PilW [Gammaproteobacteria bacterium]